MRFSPDRVVSLSLCCALLMLASCQPPDLNGGTLLDPPDDGGGGHNVFGHVQLPAGSGASLTGYKVLSLRNKYSVGPDGSFAVFTHTSDVNPVWLLDEQDRVTFAGLLNTRTPEENVLSAKSTAVVLLFYALGGPMLPAEWQSALLESLQNHPQTHELANAIESAYLADRGSFQDPESPILAALEQALTSAPGSQSTTLKGVRDKGLVEIQPTGRRGGILVESKEVPNLLMTNTALRNATYFLYRTGYETADTSVSLNPPELVGSAALPALYQVNLEEERAWFEFWLGDLKNVISDSSTLPGQAVEVLTAEDDQLVVNYHLVVAGGHIPDEAGVPDWWTQSTHPDKHKWMEESQRLPALGLVKNAFLPTVFTMVFTFGQPLAQGLTSTEADAFITEMEAYVPDLRRLMESGQWDTAVRGLLSAFAQSDAARSAFDARLNGWIGQETRYSTSEFWAAIDGAEVYLKAAAAGIKLTDVAGVLASHRGAEMMDQWEIAFKNSKLGLRVTDATVDPSSAWTSVLAEVDGAPAESCLRYRLTGPGCLVSAKQYSCEGSSNKELVTSDREVHYVVHENDIVEGTVVTVTAELFETSCDKISGSSRSTDSVQITHHEFPDPPPCDPSAFNLAWWQAKAGFELKTSGTLGSPVTVTVHFSSAESKRVTLLIPGGSHSIRREDISVFGGGEKMSWSSQYIGTRYMDVRRDDAGMLIQIPGAMQISISNATSSVTVVCPTNDLPFFKNPCPFVSFDQSVAEQLALWGPIVGAELQGVGTSMGLVGIPQR